MTAYAEIPIRSVLWRWWPLLLGAIIFAMYTPTIGGIVLLIAIQALWIGAPILARKAGRAVGNRAVDD